MPLKGFQSLCNKHAARVVSKDEGNPQYHKGNNIGKAYVTYYKIDGVVITKKERCDYLLINEETHTAYLIELKGSDLVKAARQLEMTENHLHQELSGYQVRYRIVANKCKTQEIRTSEYRKYQIRWKRRLIQRTGFIEEDI